MLTPSPVRLLEDQVRMLVEPALELADRDKPAAATAHNAQLVHDVLLEEVDANAQGVSRLALRERETAERGVGTSGTLIFDRPMAGAHTNTWRELRISPPEDARAGKHPYALWDWRGSGPTPIRRSPTALNGTWT